MMILANLCTYKAPLNSVHNVWLSFEQCKLTFMYYFCSGWLWQVERHDWIIQNIMQLFKNLNLATCKILYKNMQIFYYNYKCGHRNVLSKRQTWMSIFHIINFKKKNSWTQGSWIFFNKKLILDCYFCLKSGPVFLFQIFIPLLRDIKLYY